MMRMTEKQRIVSLRNHKERRRINDPYVKNAFCESLKAIAKQPFNYHNLFEWMRHESDWVVEICDEHLCLMLFDDNYHLPEDEVMDSQDWEEWYTAVQTIAVLLDILSETEQEFESRRWYNSIQNVYRAHLQRLASVNPPQRGTESAIFFLDGMNRTRAHGMPHLERIFEVITRHAPPDLNLALI